MDERRFERLTEKQRVCLRLVLMHRSSKEIARELGIGSDAVDQRLKTAMRTLGVESRVEAARLLAEHEGNLPYQPFVYQSPDIVPEHISAIPSTWIDQRAGVLREAGAAVREEQARFATPHPITAQPSASFPLPFEGGVRNGLGGLQRMAWIVAIAIGTAIGFGAFLSGLEALAKLTKPGL